MLCASGLRPSRERRRRLRKLEANGLGKGILVNYVPPRAGRTEDANQNACEEYLFQRKEKG